MRVVILCGGRGTRLHSADRELPKPLVEVGGMPIVWHVVGIFAAQGFTRFTLCTGYRSEAIEAFAAAASWPADVEVACVQTGLDTPTGGRIDAVRERLSDGPFFVAYSDGLADIDLAALVARHHSEGGLGTVTVVQPELPFGVVDLDGSDRVVGFHEKPRSEHWINAGFFVFEPGALDYLRPDSVLEREPLEALAAAGALGAYRHDGFWRCMDTYKDAVALNDLWVAGDAPWTNVRAPDS
jgi:glucose-1-phosphate cytidylyltransferase